jgi:hypothetical protein
VHAPVGTCRPCATLQSVFQSSEVVVWGVLRLQVVPTFSVPELDGGRKGSSK